jgi:outer membrane protein TolC
MRYIIIFIYLTSSVILFAQETLTLDQCLDRVVENSPRLKDKQLLDEQGNLTIENIKTSWYPSLMLNAKVSYQSDVVSIATDQNLPFTFPVMPNEQFGLNLDVRQTIFDGGLSKQKQKYEQASTAAAIQKIAVDLNTVKEQVTNLYFTILILQENKNNLEIAMDNLTDREKVLKSAVKNGLVEENDLQVLNVELLRLLQSMSELDAAREGSLQMLSIYMGQALSNDLNLETPYLEFSDNNELLRPELQWFELQTNILDAGKDLSAVKRMPQFFAYGQAGVGMPGYNMLNDQVDTYYLLGAGVHWNIWDWNSTKREKQIIERKKQQIQHSKESFSMNIQAGMEKEIQNLKHFENTIELDDKMLEIRLGITANAASKLDNGIISASDYLQVLNEENRTRIAKSTHKLQMLKAIANYNLLNGTL